jgi:uncharacterized membrane protein
MTKAGYFLFSILSILVVAIQARFLFLSIEMASPDMVHHVDDVPLAFWTHVVAAAIALAAGVPQFAQRLRGTRPRTHRWTGRVYVTAVVLGAVSGLVLALNARGGLVTQAGFAMLAVLWCTVTLVALYHVRSLRFGIHRRWMIRSYALTFAAVTLRLQVPLLVNALGTDYTGVLPIIAWSCWVPNLIIAEWLIRRLPQPSVAGLTRGG